MKELSMDNFWNWVKSDNSGYDGDPYLGLGKLLDFEKKLWF